MKIINIKDNSSLQDFLKEVNTPSLLRVYSDNCGHCIEMKEEWEKLKQLLKENNKDDNINIVDVESSYSDKLPDNISSSIIGYPTILALQNGDIAKNYESSRTSNDMYDFCKRYILKNSSKKDKLKGGKKIKSKKYKKRHTKNIIQYRNITQYRNKKIRKQKSKKKNKKNNKKTRK